MTRTQILNEQVWRRFVRRGYGHLLDCADGNGDTVIPTADECRDCVPNVMGWSTSIENGGFFGGLYLYGLCLAFTVSPSEKLRGQINTITDGLFLLSDVSETDGFIARGVADDGKAHYPFSSEDQCGPWILGLWKLCNSDAVGVERKEEIKKRLIRTIGGIRRAEFDIPTEIEGVTRGSYAHSDWRGVSKLLFCAAVERELGICGDEEFKKPQNERPDGGIFNRLEIASHGFAPDMVRNTSLIQFWIDVCAHLCLRELVSLDPENSASYLAGMRQNGITVVPFLDDYLKYDNPEKLRYNMNWRELIPGRRPWTTPDEAVREAGRQVTEWSSIHCKAMKPEHCVLGNMIFAAWIAISCEDKMIADHAYEKLCAAVDFTNWETMSRSYAFAAEAALYDHDAQKSKKKHTIHG